MYLENKSLEEVCLTLETSSIHSFAFRLLFFKALVNFQFYYITVSLSNTIVLTQTEERLKMDYIEF